MEQKGTILIVDDRTDEKIGVFHDYLVNSGFNLNYVGTLAEAKNELKSLLSSQQLDGIILDFSFPIDENDKSVQSNNIPNGVVLLNDFIFRIRLQQIPVIINTTGDKDYKKKYLGNPDDLRIPYYDVDHELNPLARPSRGMTQDILKLFNDRVERRSQTQMSYEPPKETMFSCEAERRFYRTMD